MSVVNEPIQDRIGERRIGDGLMPLGDQQLAGHQSRFSGRGGLP